MQHTKSSATTGSETVRVIGNNANYSHRHKLASNIGGHTILRLGVKWQTQDGWDTEDAKRGGVWGGILNRKCLVFYMEMVHFGGFSGVII
jgi:hypothetical protein